MYVFYIGGFSLFSEKKNGFVNIMIPEAQKST